MPPGCNAATMPSAKARTTLTTKLMSISLQVCTSAGTSTAITGMECVREKPKSPCSAASQPVPVAQHERLIEAIDRAQMGDHFGRGAGVAGDHHVNRIAGHQADQAVDDEAHDQQHEHRLAAARRG